MSNFLESDSRDISQVENNGYIAHVLSELEDKTTIEQVKQTSTNIAQDYPLWSDFVSEELVMEFMSSPGYTHCEKPDRIAQLIELIVNDEVFRERYVKSWDYVSASLEDNDTMVQNAIIATDDLDELEFAWQVISQAIVRVDQMKVKPREHFFSRWKSTFAK